MRNTNAAEISTWLFQLGILTSSSQCKSPGFIKPHHLVTLGLSLHGGKGRLTLPEALSGYAVRMRLWQSIGMSPPNRVVEHDTQGRFVPLQRLETPTDVEDCSLALARIAQTYGADESTVESLRVALMELIGNCFSHAAAEGQLQGLACAQSWPSGGLAQIAIADKGVGIRDSLSGNHLLIERLSAENACEMATEFGVTSKPGKGHSGYGLSLTRQLLLANGGTLVVYSGNEYFATNGTTTKAGVSPTAWEGTLVVLEWNCSRPLSIKAVYDTWPTPEGYFDDDFDF